MLQSGALLEGFLVEVGGVFLLVRGSVAARVSVF